MKYLLLICLLLSPTAWADKQTLRKQLAQRYMGLLLATDYAQLSEYLNDSSKLIDKTASKTYTGKRNIIEFLRLSTAGVETYRFEQERFFISKKTAVFIGIYHYKGAGDLYGFPNQTIQFSVPAVTVLSVDEKENIITEHRDYFDYENLTPEVVDQ